MRRRQIRRACLVAGWLFLAFAVVALAAGAVTVIWPETVGLQQPKAR